MANKLTATEIVSIGIQDDVDSYPLRTNFTNIKNKVNELVDEIAAAEVGATNAETTAARPYHTNLKERLDYKWSGQANFICDGGEVTASAPAAMTVEIAAGHAIINGIDVTWVAATSGTITAPVSNWRYDVVVVNSDSSITVVTGTASASAVLPIIAVTQKPLAIIALNSATATITASELTDARNQGCWYHTEGAFAKWQWKIQDAVDDIVSGEVFIGRGKYYEEVVLTGLNNLTLKFEDGAKVYRIDATHYCLKIDNVNSDLAKTENVKIVGGSFYGNSKAGTCELIYADYCDDILIKNCYFDGNLSSTSLYKNHYFNDCHNLKLDNNIYEKWFEDLRTPYEVSLKETISEGNPVNALALKRPFRKNPGLITHIAVSANPRAMAFDGRYIYVCGYDNNVVQIIDVITKLILPDIIGVVSNPIQIAFDGRYMYVVGTADDGVSIIDTVTKTNISADILVGDAPEGIAFDGRYMYVCNSGDDDVSIIDTTTKLKVGSDIAVGGNPKRIAFDGRYMYVCNYDDSDVSVIDTVSQTKVGSDIAVGTNPSCIAFDGKFMWVGNYTDSTVSRINTHTKLTTGLDAIAIGANPVEIYFDGKYLFIGKSNAASFVSVINAETHTLVTSVFTNENIACYAFCSDGKDIYMASSANNDIEITCMPKYG